MDFGPKYFEYMDSVYQDGYRRPFYETYAARNYFNEEAEYDRDCCRLQEMYPAEARKVQAQIKDACDKMEYEGSVMFDEYPDQLQLHLMGRRVYNRAEKDQVIEKLIRSEGKGADESWIRDLIQVMLYQEIYKRRSDQRKCNQKYYQGIAFPKG